MKGQPWGLAHVFDGIAQSFAERRGTTNDADVPANRPCVRCGRNFRSRGIGHRICCRCHERHDAEGRMEENDDAPTHEQEEQEPGENHAS